MPVQISRLVSLIDNSTISNTIAQLVFAEVKQAQWENSEVLTDTERGAGGFGSTGVK